MEGADADGGGGMRHRRRWRGSFSEYPLMNEATHILVPVEAPAGGLNGYGRPMHLDELPSVLGHTPVHGDVIDSGCSDEPVGEVHTSFREVPCGRDGLRRRVGLRRMRIPECTDALKQDKDHANPIPPRNPVLNNDGVIPAAPLRETFTVGDEMFCCRSSFGPSEKERVCKMTQYVRLLPRSVIESRVGLREIQITDEARLENSGSLVAVTEDIGKTGYPSCVKDLREAHRGKEDAMGMQHPVSFLLGVIAHETSDSECFDLGKRKEKRGDGQPEAFHALRFLSGTGGRFAGQEKSVLRKPP